MSKQAVREKTRTPATVYKEMLTKGFTEEEAVSQVAQLWGLQVSENGEPIRWTLPEVMNVLFLDHRMNGKGQKA